MKLVSKKIGFVLGVFACIVCAALIAYALFQASKLSGLQLRSASGGLDAARLRGQNFSVIFVYPEVLGPLYGRAYGRVAEVRENLPPHVERFVLFHEIFHLQDKDMSNRIMREVRASMAAAVYEPLGFVQTVFLSLFDARRTAYYTQTYF